MSMPCTYPHHDWLMYILYSCDAPFLGQIIRGAMAGIAQQHAATKNKEGMAEALAPYSPGPSDCMHTTRIKLLVLLDQDEGTRRRLCEYTSKGAARDWLPVCPHKAARFYAELHDTLIPAWIKDETVTSSEFVDRVRMAYLIS
jgi:hypothetical protein